MYDNVYMVIAGSPLTIYGKSMANDDKFVPSRIVSNEQDINNVHSVFDYLRRHRNYIWEVIVSYLEDNEYSFDFKVYDSFKRTDTNFTYQLSVNNVSTNGFAYDIYVKVKGVRFELGYHFNSNRVEHSFNSSKANHSLGKFISSFQPSYEYIIRFLEK